MKKLQHQKQRKRQRGTSNSNSNSSSNKRWDLPRLFMMAFFFVWIFGISYITIYHLDSSTSAQQQQRDTTTTNNNNNVDSISQKHRRIIPNTKKIIENPWYGWQPHYNDDQQNENMDGCTIRDCFKDKGKFENHPQCTITCLDNPNDFGTTPLTTVNDNENNWIPDATMLHRMLIDGKDHENKPWPPSINKEYCEPIGVFGGPIDDNKKLLDGVPIRGIKPPSLPSTTTNDNNNNNDMPTIFCGVYTMKENHAGNVRAMRETWAPHCNGFVAFSTESDPRIPSYNIHHEGKEEYNNMWQKSRAIWRFIGEHYLEDYDYFILGGEDLLIIPENLRKYLKSLNQSPDDDLFAGRRFKGYGVDNYFNSGGAGYVLSRGTLRKYYEIGYTHEQCNPHRHTAMEDVMIAECLRNVFHIGLTDTRDEQGRERFHPFAPGGHLAWTFPIEGQHDWYADYNKEWGLKLGLECCAPDSVSFHYIKKPAAVRHIWSLLYFCD